MRAGDRGQLRVHRRIACGVRGLGCRQRVSVGGVVQLPRARDGVYQTSQQSVAG